MKRREIQFHKQYDEIFASDAAAEEKLAEGFEFVIARMLTEADREMDILRAMGDSGGLRKEQIKKSTMKHVRIVFEDCYYRATGELLKRKDSHG